MSEGRHPIYGNLVYRRTFGPDAGGWFTVEGDHPLAAIERQAAEKGPRRKTVDPMVLRHRQTPSLDIVERVLDCRRAHVARRRS